MSITAPSKSPITILYNVNEDSRPDAGELMYADIPWEKSVRIFDKTSDVPKDFSEKTERYLGKRIAGLALASDGEKNGKAFVLPEKYMTSVVLDLNGKPAEDVVKKFLKDCKLHKENDPANLQPHFAVRLKGDKIELTFVSVDLDTLKPHSALKDPRVIAGMKAKAQFDGSNGPKDNIHDLKMQAAAALHSIEQVNGVQLPPDEFAKSVDRSTEQLRARQVQNGKIQLDVSRAPEQVSLGRAEVGFGSIKLDQPQTLLALAPLVSAFAATGIEPVLPEYKNVADKLRKAREQKDLADENARKSLEQTAIARGVNADELTKAVSAIKTDKVVYANAPLIAPIPKLEPVFPTGATST